MVSLNRQILHQNIFFQNEVCQIEEKYVIKEKLQCKIHMLCMLDGYAVIYAI